MENTIGTLNPQALRRRLAQAKRRIDKLQAALKERDQSVADAHRQLQEIFASFGWRLLLRWNGFRNRWLPLGSRPRKVFDTIFHGAIKLRRRLMRLTSLLRSSRIESPGYDRWITLHEPGLDELTEQRSTRFPHEPCISVIVPTFNTPLAYLDAMIESVRQQTYGNWELCLADGNSRNPEVAKRLRQYSEQDPRVRVTFLPENLGIVGNTNAALELARGEFVAFLDHDDTLAPFALHEIVRAANKTDDADLIYSDEDKLDPAGKRRFQPYFKPDWSPDLLRSSNYICHLTVYRTELLHRLGGLREGFEGAQDHDLVLRASEQARRIVHVPKILYHWRSGHQSIAGDQAAKLYAYEAGVRAVGDHLRRLNLDGQAAQGPVLGTYKVTYRLKKKPLISIIIPNRDEPRSLKQCLASIERSSYRNVELLIVENQSKLRETFRCYAELEQQKNVRLLTWDQSFNYAAANNFAATEAKGDVLLFLNNDVQAINPDWLERMVEHALRPEVGAVGAKLYYPDGSIQHAGVILGIGGVGGHWHLYKARTEPGYFSRLVTIQNFSAVTGACLMMRRNVFRKLGGFDERFVLAFNDVDLCVRARRKGYLVVWTPFAELYHHESKTRGLDDTPEKLARFNRELTIFLKKWPRTLERGDPYYSPNLSLNHLDCTLRT